MRYDTPTVRTEISLSQGIRNNGSKGDHSCHDGSGGTGAQSSAGAYEADE